MTDIKKVTVTSVPNHEGEKKKPKKKRTVRIILTLSESNEKSCPEFNYGDLLSQHLRRRLGNHCLGEVLNGPAREKGDPYASDEDEALKALARSFEKKYGGGVVGPKRKKRKKENDFKQLGEGYDETDPFIDNSDAIDDVLPTNVETKLGGFYINSGELNFEEVQVSEDEKSNDSQIQNLKRKRKSEIVSSEDETENVENGEVVANEDNIDEDGEDSTNAKENGILKLKKRKLDEGEMLRRRKKMIDKFNLKKQKPKEDEEEEEAQENETESKVNEVLEPVEETEEKADKQALSNGTSIAACIEAVVTKARESINMQEEVPIEVDDNMKMKLNEEEEEDVDERDDSSSDSSSSSSSSESSSSDSESEDEKEDKESEKEGEKKEEDEEMVENEEACVSNDAENDHINNASDENEKDTVLPADLPQDIVAVLDKLKEVGKNTKASSQKFFTDSVNKMLLSIEIKLCRYGGRKKNLIYNHLSHHVPCSTQTLLKRAKNLLVEKLDERIKAPTQRLKDALERAMPKLLELHALECQKLAEDKGEEQEEQEEEDASDLNKKTKLPKKKFEFTTEFRELLCEVVKIKCQGWHMVKKRSETAEEHVKGFIDSSLKNLWPKGWVTTKILYKESQSAHSLITAKNSMKTAMMKKVTVLGGGTVSNANLTNGKVTTSTSFSSTNNVNDDNNKTEEPSKEADRNSNSTLHSTTEHESQECKPKSVASSFYSRSDAKELGSSESTPIGNNKGTIDQVSNDKSFPCQLIKGNSAKILETPPKVPAIPLSSISPISESSQKSFHGFESPNKALPDVHKEVEDISSRQSLFNGTQKPYKNNTFDSSLESLPPVREGKPPKPSLTATALPKISIASSISITKGDDLKKGFSDHLDVPKTTKDDRKTITCITIKSVEKINEAVHPNSKNSKNRDKSKSLDSKDRELSKEHFERDDSVRLIDLSADDDNGQAKKETEKLQNTPSASAREVSIACKKDLQSNEHAETPTKNNKLEQEMDQVMNEILHISKKNKSNEYEGTTNKPEKYSATVGNSNAAYSVEKQSLPVSQSRQLLSSQNNLSRTLSSSSYETSKLNSLKNSTHSTDATDGKNYTKQQPQKISDITSKNQSSHSSSTQYSSAHNVQRVSPVVSPPNNIHVNKSTSNVKIPEDSSYQSSNKSQCKAKRDLYGKGNQSMNQSSNLERTSDERLVHRDSYRNSNSLSSYMHSEIKSALNSSSALQQGSIDRQSGNISTSLPGAGIGYNNPSSHSGNHRSSVQSYNGNHKTNMSNQSGSQQSHVLPSSEKQQGTASIYSGNRSTFTLTQGDTSRTSSSRGEIHGTRGPKKTHQTNPTSSNESLRIATSIHNENRQVSSSAYGESHRVSPSTSSGSHRVSPSTQFGSQQRSSPSNSGSHRSSPSTHSGNHKSSPSTQSGSHRTSPLSHSGSYRTSSIPNNSSSSNRISPSSLGGSHRTSPSRSKDSNRTLNYSSGAHKSSSPQRTPPLAISSSQSQSKSHSVGHRIPSSHNGNQSPFSTVQAGSSSLQITHSNLRKENISASVRDYSSGSRGSQIGHSEIYNLSQNLSPSRSARPSDPHPSSYQRQTKPSHNIDGLLYNSSSSSKSTTINSSKPYFQVSSQKSQAKVSPVDSSWNRESSSLSSSKSMPTSKQKSTESSPYPVSGNGNYPLSNLRLIDGLRISSSAKTSHSVSLYTSTSNSMSSRQLGSPTSNRSSLSSVQPKVKQRSDSFQLPVPHPILGNMTPEQQQDLWQQINAGGYLGIPPGEVHKYMSQQGLYQNPSKSEGSSKKSSQIER